MSRAIADHGTTMGTLSITGVRDLKTMFEPLAPDAVKVTDTNLHRAPEHGDGFFYGNQLVKDEQTRATFDSEEQFAEISAILRTVLVEPWAQT